MKAVIPPKMKCAVVCAVLLLELVSEASAVLRPLFPFKPAPPSNGELIVIEDEAGTAMAKKSVQHHRGQAQ